MDPLDYLPRINGGKGEKMNMIAVIARSKKSNAARMEPVMTRTKVMTIPKMVSDNLCGENN